VLSLKSVKSQLIIFLCCFAVYVSLKVTAGAFYQAALIAVISAIGAETALIYLKTRKIALTESSIISGLIIGLVLSSDNPKWIIAFASLSAILSKHILRINQKHLFNPAAFGIFLAVLLFGATTEWKGTYAWQIVVPFGLYFVYKIKKFEVILGYALAALGLFALQAIAQKVPLLNIFGYLSYFFIFIMLIEPKTSPLKPQGKILFGMAAGVLIFALTERGIKFDAELCALLSANASVPLLNRIAQRRKL